MLPENMCQYLHQRIVHCKIIYELLHRIVWSCLNCVSEICHVGLFVCKLAYTVNMRSEGTLGHQSNSFLGFYLIY
jgi:hypothetical protein